MVPRESLAQTAIRCLNVASEKSQILNAGHAPRYDTGSTVQPDSWLLDRCWQALADGGFGSESYSIAALAELREPLSPIKALYRMAKQSRRFAHIIPLVQSELFHARAKIFDDHLFAQSTSQIDFVLYAAAAAAFTGELLFAVSCLERLDQIAKSWDRVFIQPDLREVLAEAIALCGVTSLTGDLIDKAILRYAESGARFIQQTAIATKLDTKAVEHGNAPHPLLLRCVAALDKSILGSLHSRKIAASVFAQAGQIDKVMEQVRTIATIQDAHRETNALLNQRGSGAIRTQRYDSHYSPSDEVIEVSTDPGYRNLHSSLAQGSTAQNSTIQSTSIYNDTIRIAQMANTAAAERSRNFPVYRSSFMEADSSVIRQVSRTAADTDVDFLVYTLKDAVESMELVEIDVAQKQTIVNQLVALGLMSDGWTAAGATAALLELGGIDEAIHVVEQIDPSDPTRVECILALVNGLLDHGKVQIAQEQSQQALVWAGRLSEVALGRTLRRGLASTYIEHNFPEAALAILAGEHAMNSQRGNIRGRLSKRLFSGRWLGREVTEEQLHADRVRLAAYLKQIVNQMSGLSRQFEEASHSTERAPDGNGANSDFDGARLSPEEELNADQELPPELDQLVHALSTHAPSLLDGEALVTFYRESLLMPLLAAGKMRYAWGLLNQMGEALLTLQSNKVPVRLQQICQPMAEQIIIKSRHQHRAEHQDGLLRDDDLSDSVSAVRDSQAEGMTAYLVEFMAHLWETCAERGIWPTTYAIEGCLSTITTLFGPEPVVEIAQATMEQGAIWRAQSRPSER